MSFSDSSLLSKIGLGLSIVGTLFVVTGFSTTNWVTTTRNNRGAGTSHYGLFKGCVTTPSQSECTDLPSEYLPDWFIATRALVILGFVLGLGCMAALIVYMAVKNTPMVRIACLTLAFAAAFFVIVGIIVFGAIREELFKSVDLGWSFALTIVGGIFFLIDGIVIVVDKPRAV